MYELEKPKSVDLADSDTEDMDFTPSNSEVAKTSDNVTTLKVPPNIYEVDTEEDTSDVVVINENNVTKSDIEDNGTESDANVSQITGDLFENRTFYFSSNVSAVDKCKLKRMIVEEKGQFTSRRSKANYIISKEPYEMGSDSQSTAEIVKPLWVYESYQLKRLLPVDRYKP